MTIKTPCIITPRLLPGLKIGNSFISIEYSGDIDSEGRGIYKYHIDTPSFEYSNDDLKSGCQGGSLQEGLESLLSFLENAGEAYRRNCDKLPTYLSDLFPAHVMEWAYMNLGEIEIAHFEVSETNDCILED